MARRALTASLVLAPFAVALAMQGCTQDFSTFDPTGSGGGDPTTSTASSPTTTTGTTPNTTTTGPGGGEGGSTTVTSGGGGGSPPTDCQEPVDCDDDNDCTVDTCDDGLCVRTPVEDGPRGGDDDQTDCVDLACEGGVEVETADDTEDPPDTSAPCDISICEGGAPTQVLAEAGTSCGNPPLECDGEGLCTGCDGSPANECGDPTECSDPTCNVGDGTCDPGFTADDPADPTDGDCKALDCPGDQAEADVVNDDADLPADLPCSDRGCNAGQITAPIRAEGMACLAGEVGVCDGAGTAAANCKTCRNTADAGGTDAGCSAATPICNEGANGGEGACSECTDDVAGNGQDTGCGASEVCDAGTCRTCYVDGANSIGCATGVCDEGANGGQGECVECVDAGDCVDSAKGDVCTAAGTCGCEPGGNPNNSCVGAANGPLCNGNPGICTCDNSTQCTNSPSGDDCLMGSPRICGCDNNDDCANADGPTCTNGVCG